MEGVALMWLLFVCVEEPSDFKSGGRCVHCFFSGRALWRALDLFKRCRGGGASGELVCPFHESQLVQYCSVLGAFVFKWKVVAEGGSQEHVCECRDFHQVGELFAAAILTRFTLFNKHNLWLWRG